MTTDRLIDQRMDEQDRELYDLQIKIDEEIRTDTRNLVLVAGAIAALAMPALPTVDSLWQKAAIGTALVFFLLTIILGCLRLAYVLADLRRAIADLLDWKQNGNKQAKARYDKRQAEIRASKITGFRYMTWTQALFTMGVALLVVGIIISFWNL